MKNSKKKGFTLVELLVVIAIVAILATVAIIGYTSFTNKAHESNDRTLVAELNTAVLRGDGKKYANPHEAFEAVRAQGFDVALIKATAKDNAILWDADKGEFFYSADDARTGEHIWMVVSDEAKLTNDYNNYYVGTANIDAADITKLIHVYTVEDASLTINAPLAHVEHFGEAKAVIVKAVSDSTYVENGAVNQIVIEKGRLVVAAEAEVASVVIPETAADVKVELAEGSKTSTVIVKSTDAEVKVEKGAEVEAIAPGTEEVKTKIEEIVEVKDTTVHDKVIVEEVVETPVAGDFAGGLGTKALPYLIATPEQMRNISNYYEKGYKYFKVADGVTSLDMTGVGKINLNGSFDGNGVKLVNLTTALFAKVGYQNNEDIIKISNLEATLDNTDGSALVKNIFNAGTTTFENVTLHGYIEGQWNLGSFFNYGTANYDGVGADYTVEFINSKSDMTIACTSGNGAAGMLGHEFQGSGNTFTMIMDENSGYEGTIYTTTGKGYLYMAAGSSETFMLNGVETSRYAGYANVKKITSVNPVKGDDGYTVTPVAGATTFVVTLTSQLTAYDAEGVQITNKSGMTWTLGSVEMNATSGKVFDLITSASIVNGTDKEFGYTLKNGVLTINSGRKDNYADGWITLQVNQYDANGNLLAAGSLRVFTIVK